MDTFQVVTLDGGTQYADWITIQPASLKYLVYDTVASKTGLIFILFTGVLTLCCFVLYIWRVCHRRTPFIIGFTWTLFLLLVALATLTIVTSFQFPNSVFFALYLTTTTAQAFSSLSLLLVNLSAIIHITGSFGAWNTTLKRCFVFLFVILVHVACTWPSYASLFYFEPWVYSWTNVTTPLWYLGSLVMCDVCIATLVLLMARGSLAMTHSRVTIRMIVRYLYKKAKWASFLFVASMFNSLFYLGCCLCQYWTNWVL